MESIGKSAAEMPVAVAPVVVVSNVSNPPEKKENPKPFCAGIFANVGQADLAVSGLLRAGFDTAHITVICSDQVKERHFREFDHEQPAGAHTLEAAATGGAIGALLGGLAAAAVVVGTGGIALIAVGPLAAGAGAMFGGLVGAMTTRGVERELANYYDQAITQGKILVAAEDHSPESGSKLAEAQRILSQAGAEPVRLREG